MESRRPCFSISFTLLLLSSTPFAAASNVKTLQFFIDPVEKVPTYVQQLVVGTLERIDQGSRMTSSVSLVADSGYYILVDTPAATDIDSKELMLRGISSRNIVPGEIQLVVTTHGHPDHFGQGNFFPNARHFFASYEYSDNNYIKTELLTNDTMRLTPNVELWNTPGHTSQDVSVIVHNTPCCGIVAVVGDLFYSESDANNGTEWYAESWDPILGKLNRDKVICYANYIIPGHGKTFKITESMKKAAACNQTFPMNGSTTVKTAPKIEITVTGTTTPTPVIANASFGSTVVSPSTPNVVATSLNVLPTTGPKNVVYLNPSTVKPVVQPVAFATVDMITERPTTSRTSAPGDDFSANLIGSMQDAIPLLQKAMTQNGTEARREVIKKAHDVIQQANEAIELQPTQFRQHVEPLVNMNEANMELFAPVVESAATQLAKLLRVNTKQYPETSVRDPYPFTSYWKDQLQKTSNDDSSPASASFHRLRPLVAMLTNARKHRTAPKATKPIKTN